LRAKSFKDKALAANIPAITTGGLYPGVSNGMITSILARSSFLFAYFVPCIKCISVFAVKTHSSLIIL
jgi:hypothetical protein